MKHGTASWLAGGLIQVLCLGCIPGAAPGEAASISEGRLLLEQYDCGSCHVIPGVRRAHGQLGPSLAGFSRRAYLAGEVPSHPESLQRWIQQPTALVPDTLMPDQNVPEAHARAMSAFLLELR